jgi:photosystem II stability/assembly factor-like uncharacterized protein
MTTKNEYKANRLQAVRDEMWALDSQRGRLLLERDGLVLQLRRAGYTWPNLEVLAGRTRPALLMGVGMTKADG